MSHSPTKAARFPVRAGSATLPDASVDGCRRWLPIRRSITNPDELAYYLCFGPANTDDDTLIWVAGARGRSRNASRAKHRTKQLPAEC
ncbi:hypothetical protein GCM10022225_55690 [Plantactinospora mayteni]|uniref:Uncharacterized protein n=1 Tax=Plantactinospora mayteni TaxID=566021 RepID=A0ABQ4EUR7_9ACTN|nr:hypothetical protein Pma05_49660 [Plantactinospora mayteni]